jgi:hypothetical protein
MREPKKKKKISQCCFSSSRKKKRDEKPFHNAIIYIFIQKEPSSSWPGV